MGITLSFIELKGISKNRIRVSCLIITESLLQKKSMNK